MNLVKYRDAGMKTYTYFWVKDDSKAVISPYFNTVTEAEDWARKLIEEKKDEPHR